MAVAQHVSLAALLEVEICQFEPVERACHRLQPFPRLGAHRQSGREQAQAGVLATTDAAPQLVKLADAESVGIHHEHHRRIGYVHTDLDDGGTHQNIDLTRAERGHHRILVVGRQPAVHQAEPQPGQWPVAKMLDQLDHRGCGWPGHVATAALVGLVDT